MRKQSKFSRFYVCLVIFLLYLPIILVVAYSFNGAKTSATWGGFSLKWYGEMMRDGNLLGALWMSLKVAAVSALLSAAIGTLGAIGMNALSKRSETFMTGLAYVPLIMPEIIMGVAYLMFFSVLPVQYGMATLVIAHTGFCIPYVLFMVRVRLAGIDQSIMEAARDLGAKRWTLFWTITFPLVSPAVVTGILLAVAMSLDDVVISFFVAGPGSTTLPIKIYSMLKLGVTPKINALCTVMLLATFAVVGAISLGNRGNNQREEDFV